MFIRNKDERRLEEQKLLQALCSGDILSLLNHPFPDEDFKTLEEIQQEAIEDLELADIDFNEVFWDSRSLAPIHLAALNRHTKIIKFLISKGADVNIKNDQGITPLYLAVQNGHKDTSEMLINHGAEVSVARNNRQTPIHMAVRYNRVEILELLISKGGDVNTKDDNNDSLLHYAVGHENLEILELLLAKGSIVDAKNKQDQTPLHHAAGRRKLDIVKSLIAAGADVNAKDSQGSTPLHEAAYHDYGINIIKLLISEGADINATNKYGSTTIGIAPVAILKFLCRNKDLLKIKTTDILYKLHHTIANDFKDSENDMSYLANFTELDDYGGLQKEIGPKVKNVIINMELDLGGKANIKKALIMKSKMVFARRLFNCGNYHEVDQVELLKKIQELYNHSSEYIKKLSQKIFEPVNHLNKLFDNQENPLPESCLSFLDYSDIINCLLVRKLGNVSLIVQDSPYESKEV